MIIYLPFIPIITLLEAGTEPVVKHKFHAVKSENEIFFLVIMENTSRSFQLSHTVFKSNTYQQLFQVFYPFQQYVDAHLYMLRHSQFGCFSAHALLQDHLPLE